MHVHKLHTAKSQIVSYSISTTNVGAAARFTSATWTQSICINDDDDTDSRPTKMEFLSVDYSEIWL